MTSDLMACTLDAGDFKDRMAWIAALNARSLRASQRAGLTLTLDYDLNALDDVRKFVAGEQKCCAFLTFEIVRHANFARVSITAREQARDSIDALFTPFSSGEDPNPRIDCGCSGGCGQ